MRAHLAAAARASQSAFTEIRYEQRAGSDILQRGSEMVFATSTALLVSRNRIAVSHGMTRTPALLSRRVTSIGMPVAR